MTLQAWASHRTCRVSNHSLVVETIPLNLLHEQHTQTTDSAGYGDVPLSWRGTPPGSWSSRRTRVVFCYDPLEDTTPDISCTLDNTNRYAYEYWSINRLRIAYHRLLLSPVIGRVKLSIDTYWFDQLIWYVQRSSDHFFDQTKSCTWYDTLSEGKRNNNTLTVKARY